MARVWITRTQPAADATAARVRALGHEALVEPLLTVAPVGEGPIDLTGVAALAFTSANAVTAFAARSPDRSRSVFAVGRATARVARAAGFADVVSADGDVKALAALIARQPPDGVVLHPGAAEPAGDLAGALRAAGLTARGLILYQTVPTVPSPALLEALHGIDVVLLHSPRAARALAVLLKNRPAAHLTAVCLSPAVASPLSGAGLKGIGVAEAPNEAALVAALQQSLGL